MASTDLKLDEPGSLPRPGPIGRVVRLAIGTVCAWYVLGLTNIAEQLICSDGHIASQIWNGTAIGLFLISYVINIGYSRSWKKRPAIISAAIFLAISGFYYWTNGVVESELLAQTMWIWAFYLYTHLGTAFFLAGLIGTPGCEMRAFHYLYSRVTGVPTKEHFCPIGPLHALDQWEVGRK